MSFNRDTRKILANLRENFPAIAQSILKGYLQPFQDKAKKGKANQAKPDLYAGKLERPIHGVMHASRVASYIPVLIAFCRSIGYPQEIVDLSEDEITLLQLAALFHDIGRESDYGRDKWDKQSTQRFIAFLKKQKINEMKAHQFSRYITRQKSDWLNALLQSADSLDIMRCRDALQLECVNLFVRLEKEEDQQKFIDLAVAIRQLIADQGDLRSDCSIKYGNEEKVAAIKASYNEKKKKRYEHAENAYEVIKQKIHSMASQLNLNDEIEKKAKEGKKGKGKGKGKEKDKKRRVPKEQLIITKADQYAEDIAQGLRERGGLLKALRTSPYCYAQSHIDGVMPSDEYQLRQRPRPFPHERYTVIPEGAVERKNKSSAYAYKKLSAEELKKQKAERSSPQSVTLMTADVHSPVLDFGLRMKNPDSKLAGFIYCWRDKERKVDALLNRRMVYDGGTYSRPYEFDDIDKAEAERERLTNPEDPILFATDEEAEAGITAELQNEMVARVRFNPKTDVAAIYNDNLGSRCLAQSYARIAKKRWRAQQAENGKIVDTTYEVPIVYYIPNHARHLTVYTQAEQQNDIKLANALFDDEKKRNEHILKRDIEFLLLVDPFKIQHAVMPIGCKPATLAGKSLLQALLYQGHFSVVQDLYERAKEWNPKLTLNDYLMHPSPVAWQRREAPALKKEKGRFSVINKDNIAYLVARLGYTEMATYLLQQCGSSVFFNKGQSTSVYTPFELAIINGYTSLVKVLIQDTINIKQAIVGFDLAIEHGHHAIANLLVKDLTIDHFISSFEAINDKKRLALFTRLFIENIAQFDVEAINKLVVWAITNGDKEKDAFLKKIFIKNSSKFNAEATKKILYWVINNRDKERSVLLKKIFIEKASQLNAEEIKKIAASAIVNNDIDLLKALVEEGDFLYLPLRSQRYSLLEYALLYGQEKIVYYLYAAHCKEGSLGDTERQSVFEFAIKKGNVKLVKAMLQKGGVVVDDKKKDPYGYSLIDYASKQQNEKIRQELLESLGVSSQKQDSTSSSSAESDVLVVLQGHSDSDVERALISPIPIQKTTHAHIQIKDILNDRGRREIQALQRESLRFTHEVPIEERSLSWEKIRLTFKDGVYRATQAIGGILSFAVYGGLASAISPIAPLSLVSLGTSLIMTFSISFYFVYKAISNENAAESREKRYIESNLSQIIKLFHQPKSKLKTLDLSEFFNGVSEKRIIESLKQISVGLRLNHTLTKIKFSHAITNHPSANVCKYVKKIQTELTLNATGAKLKPDMQWTSLQLQLKTLIKKEFGRQAENKIKRIDLGGAQGIDREIEEKKLEQLKQLKQSLKSDRYGMKNTLNLVDAVETWLDSKGNKKLMLEGCRRQWGAGLHRLGLYAPTSSIFYKKLEELTKQARVECTVRKRA